MVKGCTGSQGNEIETTLLLSPKAVVKAAPIILCGEEDIAAEHGSTIGKLSNDMLFYMNSHNSTTSFYCAKCNDSLLCHRER